MNICIMSGSARQGARSKKLIDWAAQLMEKESVTLSVFDAHVHRLPLFDGEEATSEHPEVRRLQAIAKQADAFFICSPEYHNAVSGSLKNALDFLSFDHFAYKPVAIAAASGGGKGGMNALNNLRLILRGVGAYVTVNQVVVDPIDFEKENLRPEIQKRVEQLTFELLQLTRQVSG